MQEMQDTSGFDSGFEIWVRFLGQKGLLEKEMATDSSILDGVFRGQRSLEGYNP